MENLLGCSLNIYKCHMYVLYRRNTYFHSYSCVGHIVKSRCRVYSICKGEVNVLKIHRDSVLRSQLKRNDGKSSV